ncbi:MAG: hypothetical protein R2839_00325 [Thermomicrobiales bacterium]
MAPVMPGLTDSRESIEAVAVAAVAHGATSFTALPLRLAPLVKDHYLSYIAAAHPALYTHYDRNFRTGHAPEHWKSEIETLSREICQTLVSASAKALNPPGSTLPEPTTSQLALF